MADNKARAERARRANTTHVTSAPVRKPNTFSAACGVLTLGASPKFLIDKIKRNLCPLGHSFCELQSAG